jgi:hypothetical protein
MFSIFCCCFSKKNNEEPVENLSNKKFCSGNEVEKVNEIAGVFMNRTPPHIISTQQEPMSVIAKTETPPLDAQRFKGFIVSFTGRGMPVNNHSSGSDGVACANLSGLFGVIDSSDVESGSVSPCPIFTHPSAVPQSRFGGKKQNTPDVKSKVSPHQRPQDFLLEDTSERVVVQLTPNGSPQIIQRNSQSYHQPAGRIKEMTVGEYQECLFIFLRDRAPSFSFLEEENLDSPKTPSGLGDPVKTKYPS